MTLPVVFTANGPSGYNLTKSLRFRSSASAYLNRTPATAGNQQKWTYSAWVKLGTLLADGMTVLSGGTTSRVALYLNTSGQLVTDVAGVGAFDTSTAVYRDYSAWYHIVWQFDTTQSTASNRSRIYINGSQITLTQTNVWGLNTNYNINNNQLQTIGVFANSTTGYRFDGYLAEVNFIDGQALTPSLFGSTNALTGVWQPAKYTGTYGTNGFYLPFTNTTSTTTLGYDFSGNSNNWTTNNFSLTTGSTYDSMTDVPTLTSATTANYCVLNPLANPNGPLTTYSNGNLSWSNPSSAGNAVKMTVLGTFGIVGSGSFYFEQTVGASTNQRIGYSSQIYSGGVARGDVYFYYGSSGASTGSSGITVTGTPASLTTGDVVGVSYNASAGTATFYKNNTSQCTLSGIPTTTVLFPYIEPETGGATSSGSFNFGQQGFAYTPPTGFVALNTYNLPTSTIVKGNTVMDATLYTGTLLSNAVTNTAGFKPDLVWIKSRSAATDNKLTDSVRGVTKGLISNTTGAETTDTQGLTAFGTGGFTVGTDTVYNNLAATYVGWQWQAGQGTNTTNTSGSITSTVSVNASAGFSVVTYTGNGTSGATVGHGLGVAPKMIIVKRRDGGVGSTNWYVYNANLNNGTNPAQYYLQLQSTSGQGGASSIWNDTAPTSSVFSVGTSSETNGSGGTFVAYCWSEIAGFSKFTSYTGNGSADGSFVYCGFRPSFLMIKRTDTGGTDWVTMDYQRLGYNVTDVALNPNASYAENSGYATDFLANGFKLRTTTSFLNASGGTYIVMAFASNPFKNSLAR